MARLPPPTADTLGEPCRHAIDSTWSSIWWDTSVKHVPGQDGVGQLWDTLWDAVGHAARENFLYVFKAAPRGRPGRRLGGPPSLTPRLPCRRAPTPVGWPGASNPAGLPDI